MYCTARQCVTCQATENEAVACNPLTKPRKRRVGKNSVAPMCVIFQKLERLTSKHVTLLVMR